MSGAGPAVLQQWIDARIRLSKAIQAYVSAATLLESMWTPALIKSTPEAPGNFQQNLDVMEHEEECLHMSQTALKKKINMFTSPIYGLPSELLAYIFTTAVASTPNGPLNERIRMTLSCVCSH